MIRKILKKTWNFLLAIGEARAEVVKYKAQTRGY